MKGSPTKTICFFNSNKAWGGGEKWHFNTAREFQRRGYKTILVTNINSELRAKGTAERLNVYFFGINNLTFLNPIKLFVLFLFFKLKKIDTVILNLPADLKSAGIAAKLAGVTNIIYRRGMPHPLRNTLLNRLLFQKVLTKIVINSQEIGRSLSEGNEAWFPKDKMVLVYNGLDLQMPISQEKKLFQKKSNELVIGNAGRLTSQKGQKYLIEMAQVLKAQGISFQILIAGDGELKTELQNLINQKNLSQEITLLGHVSDIPAFMNSLDVFVFPSLFEGSANTLIETIYCGVPVIAFDISSNSEIIQHGINGFLAKPFDAAEMANYVLQIKNSPQLREEFAKNSQIIVSEKFDNQKNLKILEGII